MMLFFEKKYLVILICLTIFCCTFLLLLNAIGSQALVHDEAVYAIKAHSWIDASPADEFKIYRPVGMAWFGWILLHFGDADEVLRLFGVFFGSVTAVFIFLLFYGISNIPLGFLCTLVVVGSSLFLENATQFLNDVPSSGLLIGSLYVLWLFYESEGRSRAIYFFPLLTALAFYLRYGVSTTLAIIVMATLFILFIDIVRKKNINYFILFETILLEFILFFPHFLSSYLKTGNILGILLRSGDAAGRQYVGEGLLQYIKWLPNELGGWLLGSSFILGLMIFMLISFNRNWRQENKNLFWLGIIGLSNFIIVGLLVHAESRYVFFSMALMSGIGIIGCYKLFFTKIRILPRFIFVLATSLLIYFSFVNYNQTIINANNKIDVRQSYIDISNVIKKDANENSNGCFIWSSAFLPEYSWYSKCNTMDVVDVYGFINEYLLNFRKNQYTVIYSEVKESQIDYNMLGSYGFIFDEIYKTKGSKSLGDITVYKIIEPKNLRFESVVEKEK